MEPTRILLIDVSHLFWSSYHLTKDQSVSEAFSQTIARVNALREGYEFVAICCDAPPYRRKELFPAYKSNREAAPPAAHAQFIRVKERLTADGYLLWSVQGYEADDVIATAVKRALNLDEPVRVTIASGDKDLLALVQDPSVSYVSTSSGARMAEADVVAKFGVLPNKIPDLLALMGDKSDNIPGVDGVGPKRGAELLKEFGNIEGIIAGIAATKESAVRNSVMASTEILRMAQKLVKLDDDLPLNFDEVFEKREVKPLVSVTPEDLGAEDDGLGEFFGEETQEPTVTKPSTPPPAAPAMTPAKPAVEAAPQTPDLPKTQMIVRPPQVERQEAAMVQLPYELQLQPRNLVQAANLGIAIHNSRLFPKFPNEHAIAAVILRGREMGISALTSCQVFHWFDNQLVMHAHLIVAKVEEHPDCEYFRYVDGNASFATYETKSRKHPKPTELTYTIEQAKQAGLCPEVIRERRDPNLKPGEKDSRGSWEKRPAEFLRKTCAVQLGRVVFPAAALGLLSIEELGLDVES